MKAVIFDVDNTLYDARQYYFGGFGKVAEYLSKKYRFSKQNIYKKLGNLWKEKTSMYPHLFEDLLVSFGQEKELDVVIRIFNNYDGKLSPYPSLPSILKKIKEKSYKLGIISDGNAERQKRKINLLGLEGLFDAMVFTKELNSPKPSEEPFREIVDRLKITPQRSFYVGDNPLVDFEGAKKTGMKTIRLLKGEFKNMPKNGYINYEVRNLKKLLNLI